jgi:WD40 repeat protein
LITASESGSVRIWNPEGVVTDKINGPGGSVWCVALSLNGEIIASGTYAGQINLNNFQTGEFSFP